jgi:alpha-1,3-rhamnosyl/mannosyltransferase
MSARNARIGLGSTVLGHGSVAGQLDGIGVYSQNMLRGLSARLGRDRLLPVVFGPLHGRWDEPHIEVTPAYQRAATRMPLGLPYPGSDEWAGPLGLFHAPDHHIPRLRATPVVATIMDIIPLRHPEWVRFRLSRHATNWAFGRMARSAAHIVTISDYSADDIADGLRIPRERVTSIPLGVDESYFQRPSPEETAAVLKHYGLRPGFFLFVGTLQPRKNVGRIIEAHAALPEALRREHPLVIVGRNGWGTEDLIHQLSRGVAAGDCKWLRYVPQADLLPLLGQACALTYPSLFEGFGLPVVEAFAAGAPVISANTTSIPEVAGDAALLVDPSSVEQIRAAMRRIVEEPGLREELVRKGTERARRFTWAATVEGTLDIYRRFVDV